ncbi:MAG: riboflavin synthase [Pseudomonadota bacterium]
MFTGIIEATGQIKSISNHGEDSRYVFNTDKLELNDIAIGDSIAVNGCCLTVIEKSSDTFSADLSAETLSVTGFRFLDEGSMINLERAMQLSDRINGHLVSGHVDGLGKVIAINEDGRSIRFEFQIPGSLIKYVSQKGSVTIDGVSLTINSVSNEQLSVNIIPHTLQETIFQHYQINTHVNIEIDMLARYVEQLINYEDK